MGFAARLAGRRPWGPGRPFWERMPDRSAQSWQDDFEERAAIRELDGGQERGEAERHAYAETERRWWRETQGVA